jgi:hypothetical protein
VDPRVLDALTVASLAGGPEVGTAAWLGRIYVRMQVLQMIAAAGAAHQIEEKLPAKLTPPAVQQRVRPRQARVPTVAEMHAQVQKMALDGAEVALRRAGHSVTRNGDRFTVRPS